MRFSLVGATMLDIVKQNGGAWLDFWVIFVLDLSALD